MYKLLLLSSLLSAELLPDPKLIDFTPSEWVCTIEQLNMASHHFKKCYDTPIFRECYAQAIIEHCEKKSIFE